MSAYETDLDCGRVCGPCDIEETCAEADDCISGLCRAGVCHERLHEEGEAIPPGYELKTSQRDRASTARTAGIGFFAVSYGAAYVGALSLPTDLAWLYVPLIGPWTLLDNAKDFAPEHGVRMTKMLLVTDGVLQLAGALMWLGGTLGRGQQLLRIESENENESAERAHEFWVSPTVGRGGYGLQVDGLF